MPRILQEKSLETDTAKRTLIETWWLHMKGYPRCDPGIEKNDVKAEDMGLNQ